MSPPSLPRPKCLTLWVAMLLALANPAFGQSFHTTEYNELDGLPSSLVYDVDVGPDDRVWLVTRSGIGGFDGVHWEVHRQQKDFAFTIAPRHLAFDQRGRAWITAIDMHHGLGILHDGEWEQFIPKGAGSIRGDVVEFEFGPGPGDEALYALLSTGDLLRLGQEAWQTVAEQVHDFQCLPDRILLATAQGAFELDLAGELTALPHIPQVPTLALHRESLPVGGDQTWVLTASGLGLATREGYRQLHEQEGQFEDLANSRISLQPDGHGALFLGSWESTQVWDNGQLRGLIRPSGTSRGGATGITLDDHGNIWVSSLRGAYRIPPRTWEYYTKPDGLLENEVTAISALGNGKVILGHDSGISQTPSLVNPTWSQLPLVSPRGEVGRVLDLEADGDKGWWIAGGAMGPGYLSSEGDFTWVEEGDFWAQPPSTRPDQEVTSFVTDAEGVTWMACLKQVYRNRGQGFEPVPDLGFSMSVRRLVVSPKGQVFACTSQNGLLRWEEDHWLQMTTSDRARSPEMNIFNVLFPKRGPALVGTLAGLETLVGDTLYPAPWFVEIDAPIYSIFEDSRTWLWFGTERGIFRWNGFDLRHFTVKDGLPGNEVNRDAVYEDDLGRVWFGTNGGLVRFSPDREVTHPPPTIRSVLVTSNGVPLAPTSNGPSHCPPSVASCTSPTRRRDPSALRSKRATPRATGASPTYSKSFRSSRSSGLRAGSAWES